jgi:hypothetical protein
MAIADYKIWSRGTTPAKLEQVDLWDSLKVCLYWCDIATWELVLPTKEYFERWELAPTGLPGLVNGGIRIYRNNQLLISGQVVSANRVAAGDDDMITLSGMSDAYWLKTRIIWPRADRPYNQPNYNDPLDYVPRWKDTGGHYYVATEDNMSYPYADKAGTIMWGYAKAALAGVMGGAWSGRMYNVNYDFNYPRGLAWTYNDIAHEIYFPSQTAYGADTIYQGRFETVYDACKTLSHANGASIAEECHFDIITDETNPCHWCGDYEGNLVFYQYGYTDHTGEALFGDKLGTIRSYEITETRPQYNTLMVGGQEYPRESFPDGPQMRLYQCCQPAMAAASKETYGVIEGFMDYSGTDTGKTYQQIAADMTNAGDTDLADKCFDITVKITLDSTENADFMPDYSIGSLVDVQLGDIIYTDLIREIDYTVDASGGELIEPTVSSNKRWKTQLPTNKSSADARQRALDLARMK